MSVLRQKVKDRLIQKIEMQYALMTWISDQPNPNDELSCRRWLKEGKALVKQSEPYLSGSNGFATALILIKQMKSHVFELKRDK